MADGSESPRIHVPTKMSATSFREASAAHPGRPGKRGLRTDTSRRVHNAPAASGNHAFGRGATDPETALSSAGCPWNEFVRTQPAGTDALFPGARARESVSPEAAAFAGRQRAGGRSRAEAARETNIPMSGEGHLGRLEGQGRIGFVSSRG